LGEIDRRRWALFAAVDLAQPERLAEMPPRLPDQHEAGGAIARSKRDPAERDQSASRPTPPIRGGRQDRRAAAVLVLGLVVERDIAAHDREVERAAGLAMPSMQPTIWPMISGRCGLPKLRQSVAASGVAPTAVRLRQHSAIACLPPSNGSAKQ
jgi:hypothetical protein